MKMKLHVLATIIVIFTKSETLATSGDEMTNKNSGAIAKESDHCICTEEYSPVCGANNTTYPNACEAMCARQVSCRNGEKYS